MIDTAKLGTPISDPSMAPATVPEEIAKKIQKVSDTEFNVDRSVVDSILENQADLPSCPGCILGHRSTIQKYLTGGGTGQGVQVAHQDGFSAAVGSVQNRTSAEVYIAVGKAVIPTVCRGKKDIPHPYKKIVLFHRIKVDHN